MAPRKRKGTKTEPKAKPAKLGKNKSAEGTSGVPLWQIILGVIIICSACVGVAVVSGIISIDDIKAIENPIWTNNRTLVEEPELGDTGSSSEERNEDDKTIAPDVKPEKDETIDEIEEISPPLEMEIENVDEGSTPSMDETQDTHSEDEGASSPLDDETESVGEDLVHSMDEIKTGVVGGQDEVISPPLEDEMGSVDQEPAPSVDNGDRQDEEKSLPQMEETESIDEETFPSLDDTKMGGADDENEEAIPSIEETESIDEGSAWSVDDARKDSPPEEDEETAPPLKEEFRSLDEDTDPSVDDTDGQDEGTYPPPVEEKIVVDEELAPSLDQVKIDGGDAKDEEEPLPKEETDIVDEEQSEDDTDGQDEETSVPVEEKVVVDEESSPSLDEAKVDSEDAKDKEEPLPKEETDIVDEESALSGDDTDRQDEETSVPVEEKVVVDKESAPSLDEAKVDSDDAKDEDKSLPKDETDIVDEEPVPSGDDADGHDKETFEPLNEETERVGKVPDPSADETKTNVVDGQDDEANQLSKEEAETVDEGSSPPVDDTDGQGEETSESPQEESERVAEVSDPSVDETKTDVMDGQNEEATSVYKEEIDRVDEELTPSVDGTRKDGTDSKERLPLKEETEPVDEESAPSVDETKTFVTDSKDEETFLSTEEIDSVDEEAAPAVDEIQIDVTDVKEVTEGDVGEKSASHETKTDANEKIGQNLRGDLAGSDTIRNEEREKSVKEETAEEDNSDPLMNASDLKLTKEIEAADKLLQKKRTEQALRKFESLLTQHPDSPRVRYGRAQALDQLAEEKRSNELLKGCIDAYGEVALGSDCPDELKKLALRRQAERMSFFGQTRPAVTVLAGLVKDFPSDPQIKKELGVQYLIMGADAKAKPHFEQVLKVNPEDGFAKVHLGFILKREGLFEEAIKYLKEGIESNQEGTTEGKYFFHLGDAYHRTGHPEEAHRIYALGAERGLFRSAMQRSLYNVDTLYGKPWWTPREAKFEAAVKKLESNWRVILEEGLALMNKETQLFESEDESLRDTGDWKQFMLYMRGKKDDKNCKRAPETCKIIDTIPQSAGCRRGQVKFSVMHPGTHVWPHTGPTNCRLRAHLGLVVPEGTRIRVVNETRTWEEGKVLIFDDSFEHEVWQEAESFRLILIVDLWHPGLTEQQKNHLSPI